MIQDIIRKLSRGMHDKCESYLMGNGDPDIITDVNASLSTIDAVKQHLSYTARTIHESLLHSQEELPPKEFIERVYRLCCGYTL
jgi:hypothetical protein